MKENLTEVVFILDRSGSMSGLESDTIGGFNAMIEKQRKGDGEALISTVLFNDQSEVLHDRADVKDVRPLTEAEYSVGGSTALLDAIRGAIHPIGDVHPDPPPRDVPERTPFGVTTDGAGKASRRYGIKKVRQMIELEKSRYGWEFLFLGANIDAIQTAAHFGIGRDRAANSCSDSEGTRLNYDVMSEAISTVRLRQPLSADWKRRIDEDCRRRSDRKGDAE